jgi:DNA-binding HxlR family transcriptional regulator
MTDLSRSPRIRYDEGCLAAHALNLVGDRWALLVVREMMFAAKRFGMLREGLPGITAGVLTQRLAQLVETDIVAHDAATGVYGLTASGRRLMPVLQALCRWGVQYPGHDPNRFISPTALMISMTEMIQRDRARGTRVRAGILSGREGFLLSPDADGSLQVKSTAHPRGDFLLEADGNRLAVAVYGKAQLAQLIAEGVIAASGDLEKAQLFLNLFRLR